MPLSLRRSCQHVDDDSRAASASVVELELPIYRQTRFARKLPREVRNVRVAGRSGIAATLRRAVQRSKGRVGIVRPRGAARPGRRGDSTATIDAIVRRSHLLLRGRRGALYQNKLKPAAAREEYPYFFNRCKGRLKVGTLAEMYVAQDIVAD